MMCFAGSTLLFGVVRRISEQSRENAAGNTISTFDYGPMLISVEEVLVEEEEPERMHKLSLAMCQNCCRGGSSKHMSVGILERIRQLQKNRDEWVYRKTLMMYN